MDRRSFLRTVMGVGAAAAGLAVVGGAAVAHERGFQAQRHEVADRAEHLVHAVVAALERRAGGEAGRAAERVGIVGQLVQGERDVQRLPAAVQFQLAAIGVQLKVE